MLASDRRLPLAAATVALIGLATIAGAWGFQLIGGYIPCKLCLEERIPYYAGIPLAVLALLAGWRGPPWLARLLLLAAALVFVAGAGLGTYHAGAEWGWWAGPSDCGGGAAVPLNAGDLLGQIAAHRVVSCTEASWRFPPAEWGLSFAGWNAAIAAGLALVALAGALAWRPAGAATQRRPMVAARRTGTI